MKKVLILAAHRPQRSPSQRYRFEQYLPYLEQKGFAFTFSYLINASDDIVFYAPGSLVRKGWILLKTVFIRFKDLFRFRKYDIIFIQREALFFGTSFFEKRAVKSGAKVIFDFDDSIWLEDTSPANRKFAWLKRPSKFFTNVQCAHLVLAGNAYLAGKTGSPGKTVIIPTTVDTDFHKPLKLPRNDRQITIGWAGSISTIKHFERIIPVLIKLKSEFGSLIHIKLMGQEKYVHPLLEVEGVKWTHETEVEVLNTFDIGIMPLPDDEWARGKCGLKALTYMACGIPTVASPVGVNSEIIDHGKNGFLAGEEEQWFEYMKVLIKDRELRQKIGSAGRETVCKNYSVEVWKSHYLTIMEK